MREIKLIVFDLDGVLVDSREIHYLALNRALEVVGSEYVISREDHLARYDGNPTSVKLKMLTAEKGLDPSLYHKVWSLKQKMTLEVIRDTFQYDTARCAMLRRLKADGFTLFCASNSIWKTVCAFLHHTGMIEYFDYFISNEEVKHPKPHPEIYSACVMRAHLSPGEVLILEDSDIGKEAAIRSGCHLLPVGGLDEVKYENIRSRVDNINKQMASEDSVRALSSGVSGENAWEGRVNVVIPMAGEGSRFAKAGYTFPKPLIDVNGKPMIQVVVENLGIRGNYIFIVRQSHLEKYQLRHMLSLIAPGCKIIVTDGLTEGAACSVLLAKEHIDNDLPMVLANSDQFLEWNSQRFMYVMSHPEIDAGISTFENTHPKWSYAKLGSDGFVSEVAEKKPISNIATTGIYYWKRGSDFVKYAEQMISKNIRTNGEFYVCPVFNEAIGDGKKIKVMNCERMWSLGVPEDLEYYLQNYGRESHQSE